MKKNLSLSTAILLLITILLAGGCNKSAKQKETEAAGAIPAAEKVDTTKVDIYLKAVEINGSMHLEMYHEKKPDCPVIDGLLTVVYGGYTVTWRKAQQSNIDEVVDISPIDDPEGIFSNLERNATPESLWTLIIPEDAKPDTIKYKIDFKVRDDKDSIYTIDPYLRIPREVGL